jgi:hypothetical protein
MDEAQGVVAGSIVDYEQNEVSVRLLKHATEKRKKNRTTVVRNRHNANSGS